MPRTDEQLEQIREDSRERILASALRLFAEHGFTATSVRMIAQDAGISQGLLYNYFDGKVALLRAILSRMVADVQGTFEEAAGGATPQERIAWLIRAAMAAVRSDLAFWRLTYQLRMKPGVIEGLGESLGAASEGTRMQLEGLLRGAGVASPEVEARVLFAAIDGAAQHYALDPEHYPLEAVTEALVGRFAASPADVADEREQRLDAAAARKRTGEEGS